MNEKSIIRKTKEYLRKHKTVDLIWFTKELDLNLDKRKLDIINQGIVNGTSYINYIGHNKDDISIKYSPSAKLKDTLSLVGTIIGTLGGILGIVSFFRD